MFKSMVFTLAAILFIQSQSAKALSFSTEQEKAAYLQAVQQETQLDSMSDEDYENYINMLESQGDVQNADSAAQLLSPLKEETSNLITDENSEQNIGGGVGVDELQNDALLRVKNKGRWAFQFLYVSKKDNSVKILSELNARTSIKPASTLKIFTGWLAFMNNSYPQSSLSIMLHKSDNHMADQALRSVAKSKGYKEIENNGIDELMNAGLSIMKKNYSGLDGANLFHPVNGSGLNTTGVDTGDKLNKVTVRTETHLLQKIYASGRYNEFKKLLAQPGEFGTLKRRLTATDKFAPIYAKTGTLALTKALAGFAETKKGVLIFAIIGDELRVNVHQAAEAIDDIVYKHAKYLVNKGL